MKKIYGSLVFLALVVYILAAGCVENGGDIDGEMVLVVGDMWRASSINPGDGHDGGTFITEKAIVIETLVGANGSFSLMPNLAESWKQISATVWEFQLRKGVTFHNGDEMTAADVKTSLDNTMHLSPSTAKLMSYDRAEVAGKYTLRIHTKELNPLVPGVLHHPATAIVSSKSYDADGSFVRPIGTGPMQVESFNEQIGELVVVKYANWWGGDPGLDRMILRGYESPSTRAMMIESGGVDLTADPPYSEIDRLGALSDIHVERHNTPRIYKLDVNLAHETMANLHVRKAVSYAIDRTGIVDNVLYGVGAPAGGVFLPNMIWSNKNLTPYPYDPALAKRYLARAGWIDTDDDGYVDMDGKKLHVKIYTYTERPGLSPMLEAISANLKAIGIEAEGVSLEYNSMNAAMADDSWDLYLSAMELAMVPDPEFVLKSWYTTTGLENKPGYSNTDVDRLIAEGHFISDLDKRYDRFREIEAIVYDDLPTINVAYYGVAIVMKDIVTGYQFDPTAHDYRIDPFVTISARISFFGACGG
ncbi:MAG: ABC transporter substrate-binding protein [Methanocalculaceae archaeon]|jgi:peptide/nickel transport system substrate-binding protein|nr:ABC transporter substrate-binding protein [Methanocalculaceae archaeon]